MKARLARQMSLCRQKNDICHLFAGSSPSSCLLFVVVVGNCRQNDDRNIPLHGEHWEGKITNKSAKSDKSIDNACFSLLL